ncbi:2-C-methyl-D-erythritol 4-phosphate cytidylyltransferase [Motilibacter rhizosphaerae]|uniref:2-C-methyl-D-erythritol 4-phosphate cytidylyltransferase n=1 Tax=Motilibacter rhizosphaerae TaxID=598652 RepID=A0A4Q7NQT9_9ACTN|nr:2-C-methyl-D-erythritol 4-phosphate cytidylyltransferase [Motilibacter rhizosphaerae]RZS87603.1 2-C-methyl-D-erythritol 4-phosphate cytidylyltransferase [Motilibacter rhizosphaerae]
MSVAVLVPAAGRGERLGPGAPKALREVGGEPLLRHALRSLGAAPEVDLLVVAGPPGDLAATEAACAGTGALVVAGGTDRRASVAAALRALPPEVDVVLVSDAARPFVPVELVQRVVATVAAGAPAVVPGLPVADTVKQVDGTGHVVATPPRELLRAVQTPQGFARVVLERAHALPAELLVTDDAGLVEALGLPVLVVPGAPEAFKVTRPEDVEAAEALLRRRGAGR